MKKFVAISLLVFSVLLSANICRADELQGSNVSSQSNLTLSSTERNTDNGNAGIKVKDRILIAVEKAKPDMLRIGEETTTNLWQQLSTSTVKVSMYLFSW